jgi:hypothetical protein
MKTEMTAEEYRRFTQAHDDGLTEMDAAQFVELMKRGSASSLVPASTSTTSAALEEFKAWLHAVSPLPVLEEVEIIPGRKFRADWFIPYLGLVFEYDGVKDHGSIKGSERDAEKSNLAQLNGMLFIRVNSRSIRDGSAYQVARRAFQLRGATLREDLSNGQ